MISGMQSMLGTTGSYLFTDLLSLCLPLLTLSQDIMNPAGPGKGWQ